MAGLHARKTAEPVVTADALRVVLAAAVTVGWVQLDDTALATVATVAAFLVHGAITLITRSRVAPTTSVPLATEPDEAPATSAPVPEKEVPIEELVARTYTQRR